MGRALKRFCALKNARNGFPSACRYTPTTEAAPALRRLYNVIRVVIIEMIAESLDISVNVILDCGRRADEQTPPRCWAYSITREAGACRGDIQRIIGID